MENSSGESVIFRKEGTAMRLRDGAGQSQAQAHPAFPGGVKGIENPVQLFRRNPMTAVLHTGIHGVAVMPCRTHHQPPAGHRRVLHGIHSVEQEIEHHLSDLHGVGEDRRKIMVQFLDQSHSPAARIGLDQLQGIGNHLVQVDRDPGHFLAADERTHPLDHRTGPEVVPTDIAKNLPHLTQRWIRPLQQHFGGIGVAENGPQRLIHFVRDGRRHFPQHGQARSVGDLLAGLFLQMGAGHILGHHHKTRFIMQRDQLGRKAQPADAAVGSADDLLVILQRLAGGENLLKTGLPVPLNHHAGLQRRPADRVGPRRRPGVAASQPGLASTTRPSDWRMMLKAAGLLPENPGKAGFGEPQFLFRPLMPPPRKNQPGNQQRLQGHHRNRPDDSRPVLFPNRRGPESQFRPGRHELIPHRLIAR